MGVEIEPLSRSHERRGFDCSNVELNAFLERFAGQNEARGLRRTFVATADGENQVIAYHCISSGAVSFEEMPEGHPIPVVHLGRLAVDVRHQGRRLGELLLMDALGRASLVSEFVGVYAVEVRAIDEAARRFYLKYGFMELKDDRRQRYLPMSLVRI